MIKIACAGYPIAQKTYQENLPTVELSDFFEKLPLATTIERWRREAPKHFEFIVCASKQITHESRPKANLTKRHTAVVGAFQDTAGVRHATDNTLAAAEVLGSRMVYFQLPSQFSPTPDNIKRLQRYFTTNKPDHKIFAWETPLAWPFTLVEKLSFDHRLMPVMNPLGRKKPSPSAPMRYYRLGSEGRTWGIKKMSQDDLKNVRDACDLPLCYVVFNNGPSAYQDALRFKEMTQ